MQIIRKQFVEDKKYPELQLATHKLFYNRGKLPASAIEKQTLQATPLEQVLQPDIQGKQVKVDK